MATRIQLADDHRIMRQGLRALLEREPDFTVVAETGNGHATVQTAHDRSPDIVIMDVSMPDMNGIEATRRILAANAHARIIALSMHSDRRFVGEMLKAGAMGYILKDCALEELSSAIRAVMNGYTYLSPRITGFVVKDYLETSAAGDESAFALLTPREREVLQMTAEGHTNKIIAATLGVSVKTIETHRRRVMSKLNVDSVAELTKYAIREGLTSLDS